jgi:YfiH family protein
LDSCGEHICFASILQLFFLQCAQVKTDVQLLQQVALQQKLTSRAELERWLAVKKTASSWVDAQLKSENCLACKNCFLEYSAATAGGDFVVYQKDEMSWHRSALLNGLPHGMFSRCDGVSGLPFASLNLSYGVGDSPENVAVNRQRLKQALGIKYLASAVQVHGDRVLAVEDIRQDIEYEGADALVTGLRGVGLLIQQADCQAVLLHDPVREVIGAAHNGWKGSVLNIIAATVRLMQERYSCRPADMRAVISPSLGPCCAEFVNWRQELPASMRRHQIRENHFDFWAVSREQLLAVGLRAAQIETAGICTVCNRDFFSYRRAVREQDTPGRTGRCGSVIALPSEQA